MSQNNKAQERNQMWKFPNFRRPGMSGHEILAWLKKAVGNWKQMLLVIWMDSKGMTMGIFHMELQQSMQQLIES